MISIKISIIKRANLIVITQKCNMKDMVTSYDVDNKEGINC